MYFQSILRRRLKITRWSRLESSFPSLPPLQAAIAANVDAYYDEVEYQREKYGQYNVWPPTHNQYGGGSEEGRMLQEVGSLRDFLTSIQNEMSR